MNLLIPTAVRRRRLPSNRHRDQTTWATLKVHTSWTVDKPAASQSAQAVTWDLPTLPSWVRPFLPMNGALSRIKTWRDIIIIKKLTWRTNNSRRSTNTTHLVILHQRPPEEKRINASLFNSDCSCLLNCLLNGLNVLTFWWNLSSVTVFWQYNVLLFVLLWWEIYYHVSLFYFYTMP